MVISLDIMGKNLWAMRAFMVDMVLRIEMLMVKEYWSLLLQITFFWDNSKVIEKNNHLITYQSGNSSSQIDYILRQHDNFHVVKDINP